MGWYGYNIQSSRPLSRTRIRVVSENTKPVYSDTLVHYGIPGQKWGERRYQNEDGTLTEEGKIRYAKEPESKGWKKSDLKNLSDEELNKRNLRLQREKQYKDLTTTDREREISQFKKDVIKKALILPVLAVIGIAGRKYIGNAATKVGSIVGKYGKIGLSKLKSRMKYGNVLKRATDKYTPPKTANWRAQANLDNFTRRGMRRAYPAGKANSGYFRVPNRNYNYWPRGKNPLPRTAGWPKL